MHVPTFLLSENDKYSVINHHLFEPTFPKLHYTAHTCSAYLFSCLREDLTLTSQTPFILEINFIHNVEISTIVMESFLTRHGWKAC